MSCDDHECSNLADCQGDRDTTETKENWDMESYTNACDEDYAVHISWEQAINPPDGDHDDEEELADLTNGGPITLTTWTTDVSGQLMESCDDFTGGNLEEPSPESVELVITHDRSDEFDHDNDRDVWDLTDPWPEDNSDSDDVQNAVFGILAAVGSSIGHPLIRAGAAATTAYLDDGWFSDPIQFDDEQEGNYQIYWWTLELEGNSPEDFPDSPCDSVCVDMHFRTNHHEPVDYARAESYAKWDWIADRYEDGYCGCPDDGYYAYYHEGIMGYDELEFFFDF